MQFANGAEIKVQVFRVELELPGYLIDRPLEFHERNTDVLDFLRCEGLLFEAPDCLALHQLADELDEAEDELDDRTLHVFGFWIPAQRGSALGGLGASGAVGA